MGKKSKLASIAKTQLNLNIVHQAVVDEEYEFGLSKLKTLCAKGIPEQLRFYSEKLSYQLKRSICDWDSKFAEETKEFMNRTIDDIAPGGRRRLAVDPFFALCLPFTPAQLCQLNEAHAACPPSKSGKFSTRKKAPRNDGSLLRVGYMSSDFHDHSLSHLVSSIARYHFKFEVYMIHFRHDSDFGKEDTFFRNQVNQGATKVIDLSKFKNDSDAAKCLASYDLDILVDYNSSSSQHRRGILAKKPAKIQVLSMIGFCGSSGNPAVDYVLTDQTIAPFPTLDQHFTEKGAYLPGCYLTADYPSLFPHLQYERTLITQEHGLIIFNGFQPLPLWIGGQTCIQKIEEMITKGWNEVECNGFIIYRSKLPKNWRQHPLQNAIVLTCRAEFNLPTQGVVFSNLCPSWKLDPPTFSGWMEILRRVPNSVLWQFDGNPTLIKNMKTFAQENSVAEDRLVFSSFENEKEAHLRRIQLSDVVLDTTVLNGHTSSMDAMWAGIPLVTVTGATAQGRVSTSILQTMGLPQLIAKTPEEAIEIAVELGNEPTKLRDLKRVVQERKLASFLFNVPEYVRNLEGLYRLMMRRYEKGKKPRHIIMSDFEDLETGEPSLVERIPKATVRHRSHSTGAIRSKKMNEGEVKDSETEVKERKIFVTPSSQPVSSLAKPYIRLGPKISPRGLE